MIYIESPGLAVGGAGVVHEGHGAREAHTEEGGQNLLVVMLLFVIVIIISVC